MSLQYWGEQSGVTKFFLFYGDHFSIEAPDYIESAQSSVLQSAVIALHLKWTGVEFV